MTSPQEVPPLVVEFEVGTTQVHAFETWVSRPGLWWPPGHTMSGRPTEIVIEPRADGRIFERDEKGQEFVWGTVVECDPPRRIRYLWHLFFLPTEATDVEVTFTPSGSGTVVRLVQTGWDQLGDQGHPRRERTVKGWAAVTGDYCHYIDDALTPHT